MGNIRIGRTRTLITYPRARAHRKKHRYTAWLQGKLAAEGCTPVPSANARQFQEQADDCNSSRSRTTPLAEVLRECVRELNDDESSKSSAKRHM